MSSNTPSQTYTFTRYLAAKKSVDDRSLNQHVWDSLAAALPDSDLHTPLRILEIGAGIGTMLERMLERKLLHYADYTALDAQPENTAAALKRLPAWASANHHQINKTGADALATQALARNGAAVQRQDCLVNASFVTADLFDFIAANNKSALGPQRWDLLVAHAFLDLMNIPTTLPLLFNLLHPGGLFYFTINFDGATLFEPAIDPVFDAQIETLYHHTMDERTIEGAPSGDSQAGRHLFGHIHDCGGQILAAGASDWVVFPGPQGYPHDEAYFLHFIIHTLHQALSGHPQLDAERFEAWIARRHEQVEEGRLVYIAHQLDFLGHVAP